MSRHSLPFWRFIVRTIVVVAAVTAGSVTAAGVVVALAGVAALALLCWLVTVVLRP